MSSSKSMSGSEAFRAGWSLLSKDEKRRTMMLAAGIIAAGFVDAAALASVLPVVHLVTDPNAMESSQWLRQIYSLLGSPQQRFFFPILAGCSLALLLLSSVLRLSSEYVTFRVAAACQRRLSADLLSKALNASYDWALHQNPTKLTRLIQNDVSLWANSFVRRTGIIANAWVTGAVAIGLVLMLLSGVILVVLAIMAALAWLTLRLSKPAMGGYAATHRRASERIAMIAHQALSGLKDVKMTNSAPAMIGLFDTAVGDFGRAVAANNALRQLPNTLIMFLGQAALIVVALYLWWTGMNTGEIASQVALLVLASSRVIPAMNRLSAGAGVLWDALPYMQGIVELANEIEAAQVAAPHDNAGDAPLDWGCVVFEEVSYRYPGIAQPAVEGVSFSIERGKSYGVVGPSGAGKSTVVDLLAGLLEPDAGRIFIDSAPLSQLSRSAWRAQIGYVGQAPFILDDSLRANVAFGVHADAIDDDLVWECLRRAHLEDVTRALQDGLHTQLGDRGIRLSGGQRQRIAVARALYKRPKLLILDEATSALDGISERAIQAAIAEMHGRITIVTIAHRLAAVQDCDEILLFDSGRLCARGCYGELLTASALFRDLGALYNSGSVPLSGS